MTLWVVSSPLSKVLWTGKCYINHTCFLYPLHHQLRTPRASPSSTSVLRSLSYFCRVHSPDRWVDIKPTSTSDRFNPVQTHFALRIYKFSKNRWIPLISVLLSVIGCIGCVGIAIQIAIVMDIKEIIRQSTWLLIANAVLRLCNDVLITVAMVVCLYRERNGIPSRYASCWGELWEQLRFDWLPERRGSWINW